MVGTESLWKGLGVGMGGEPLFSRGRKGRENSRFATVIQRPTGMGGGAGRLLDDTSGPESAKRNTRPVFRSGGVLFTSAGFVGCDGVVKAHGGNVESLRRGRCSANPHFDNAGDAIFTVRCGRRFVAQNNP